jgi:ABC-type branched-subunit amino acid transport system ATPase component
VQPAEAGRRSLLNVISGLYAPDGGTVRIGDATYAHVPAAQKYAKEKGIVPRDRAADRKS